MSAFMIRAADAELCVETFGRAGDPAILLIHGACASMLWWERALCEEIAARGFFVIRYDNRDTGRSTSYPPHQPGYSLRTMTEDAVAILDALSVERAHIVGRSMSAAIALALGVDYGARVRTLTFVTATSGDPDLPEPTAAFLAAASAQPDFSDRDAIEAHIYEIMRAYAGESPYFDAAAMRALIAEDVARTPNIKSALTNHFEIAFDAPAHGGFTDLTQPSLVVHGELDPVFPLPHGLALQRAIPGAELLVLKATGHDVPRPVWPEFVAALVAHIERA